MHFLFKPEEVALEKIKLTNKKMLDIGVGTGRTTRFFSPKTKKYIGIDYSKNMIKKCIETFETSEKRKFLIRDIRRFDYPGFFDFILFSYNGIDYMDHKDRKKSLIIIKNLLNEEGARA
jgi:SAM-dependent methyltransferase